MTASATQLNCRTESLRVMTPCKLEPAAARHQTYMTTPKANTSTEASMRAPAHVGSGGALHHISQASGGWEESKTPRARPFKLPATLM